MHRRSFICRSVGVGLGVGALALGAFGAAGAQEAAKAAAGAKWICPPCGCPSDGQEFDKPGACPSCGMILIQKPAPAPAAAPPAKTAEPPATPAPAPDKAPKAGP